MTVIGYMNNLLMTMKVNGNTNVEEQSVENSHTIVQTQEVKQQPVLEITLFNLLDRFEILYGDKVTNLRRFYNDGHLLDLLRITGKEDLRRFVEEKLPSLFRYPEDKGFDDIEDIRKLYIKKCT